MTSAAVGFQCPECVAEGRASAPGVRSVLGAKVPTKPYVTYTLIGLCVLAFGWQYIYGIGRSATEWGMLPVAIALDNQYARLITSVFLHGGFLHIAFNLLAVWLLGPQLEYLFGHVRFAVLYLVAGLGGAVASFWFSDPTIPSVGASGAIFGLMGAWFVVARRLNGDVRSVLFLIGLNLVVGFVGGTIDWRAHLGGLATGATIAVLFAYTPPDPG